MERARYFDHAATTPLAPEVLDAMLPYFDDAYANPHSIHTPGRRAMAAVDRARAQLAELIGAEDPSQIVFTSGATEALNWVLSAHPSPNSWVSPFEHSAGLDPAILASSAVLINDGLALVEPGVDPDFLSVMSVNNEIGARWEVRRLGGVATVRHADLTQQVGKLPTDITGLDFASMSAHKAYGPKGVGALYVADPAIAPWMLGGEQEEGRRAGTLNVPAIVGFGAAAALASERIETDVAHAEHLRALLLADLEAVSDWTLNGGPSASPYILSLSFLGVEGETLVIEADAAGYAISAGAACSSRSTEPSHVLVALRVPEVWRRGTIRVSFGRDNTESSTAGLAQCLLQTVEKLRTMT